MSTIVPAPCNSARAALREARRGLSSLSGIKSPSHFEFRKLASLNRTRVYFLCGMTSVSKESTLFFVDVSDDSPREVPLQWNPLFEPSFQKHAPDGIVCKQELMMLERKRLCTRGITHFNILPDTGHIMFPAAASIYRCVDPAASCPVVPCEIRSLTVPSSSRLNAEMCPFNPELVAFVSNNDLWVTHVSSGIEVRLTHVHKPPGTPLKDNFLSAGMPCYVTQEEFNRYNGFWWCPDLIDGQYAILYEEVDEEAVNILRYPQSGINESGEFRFPSTGEANAISRIKLVTFSLGRRDNITEVVLKELKYSLNTVFDWAEYVVRAGWTPDGERIWVQLLNRRQDCLEVIAISLKAFIPVGSTHWVDPRSIDKDKALEIKCENLDEISTLYHILYSIESRYGWVGVNDSLTFLSSDTDPGQIRFVVATEETSWRHLYLITAKVGGEESKFEDGLEPEIVDRTALTSGSWSVSPDMIWIDETRELVYFQGYKDTPLEKHLYVVSLKQPNNVRRITLVGFSHSIAMNSDCSLFVTVFSSLQCLPGCQTFHITHTDDSLEGIYVTPAGWIIEQRNPDNQYCAPEIHSRRIVSGDLIYSLVFKPPNFDPRQKYPVVLNVYGGPEVQQVTNSFKGVRQLRSHLLATQGYIVVCIDTRGSENRGSEFENHLRCRMGQVEMKEQVEVLCSLSQMFNYMDMTRVGLIGWSYGGYLSLMGLVQFPTLFKVVVAGAPVVSWEHYDTGYTERYMDLPSNNAEGYRLGSVLTFIDKFPDEPNRLLIVHGLMDENVHFLQHTTKLISELVKAGKPYQLQIYPGERHSLRSYEASDHYEATLLTFLKNNL